MHVPIRMSRRAPDLPSQHLSSSLDTFWPFICPGSHPPSDLGWKHLHLSWVYPSKSLPLLISSSDIIFLGVPTPCLQIVQALLGSMTMLLLDETSVQLRRRTVVGRGHPPGFFGDDGS